MGWQRDYQARNWTAVENWWRRTDNLAELKALLAQLQRDVPRRTLTNGTDIHIEFYGPKNAPEEWKGAALILEFGELEAKINGDPASDIELWAEQQTSLREELHQLASSPEVTTGDSLLSCRAHAERALEALERINDVVGFRIGAYEPDEQEPLREFVALVAIYAMRAGYFAYAAESKVIQAHSARGQVLARAASKGGEIRALEVAPRRERILSKMVELKETGRVSSIQRVADLAFKQGYGTSGNANRQLWKRYMK